MAQDPFAQEYKETIDADAVCSQCGRENPEGTLLCRYCGNNLRDQRLLRLAADTMMAGEEKAQERRTFLVGALTVLGLLVVLWLGINVSGISARLTSVPANDGAPTITLRPFIFWEGADAAVYAALERTLNDSFPTASQAETVRMNPSPNPAVEGVFVLYERLGTNLNFVGGAVVRMEGDKYYFVARLLDGATIRGTGRKDAATSAFLAEWTDVGIRRNDSYYAGTGELTASPDGGFTLRAMADFSERTYQAVAYPLRASY